MALGGRRHEAHAAAVARARRQHLGRDLDLVDPALLVVDEDDVPGYPATLAEPEQLRGPYLRELIDYGSVQGKHVGEEYDVFFEDD